MKGIKAANREREETSGDNEAQIENAEPLALGAEGGTAKHRNHFHSISRLS